MKKKPKTSKRSMDMARKFTARHKFLIVIACVVAVVTGVFVADFTTQIYNQWQDEKKVNTVVKVMSDTQANLAKVEPSLVWKNLSHCTTIKPRLFGDKERFTCTSRYVTTKQVPVSSNLNELIAEYQSKLKQESQITLSESLSDSLDFPPSISQNENDNMMINHAISASFMINDLSVDKWCAINYTLSADAESAAVLEIDLRCTINTLKTYYEPIEVQE